MAFSGYSFIFNNILSDRFGLRISNIEQNTVEESPLLPDVEFILHRLPRRAKAYHLGTKLNELLSFKLTFFSENPIYSYEREQIALWLSGDGQFRKLQIVQEDMSALYYNCYFSRLDWNSIGNVGYGFTGTIVCDSSSAWRLPITFKRSLEPTTVTNGVGYYPEKFEFDINNTSTDYLPIIPDITVQLAPNATQFSISNVNNKSKGFKFQGLQSGEIISVDNFGIIKSLSYPNKVIIDNFNGTLLKLIKGKNHIVVNGSIKEITVTYQLSRKIGG